MLDQKLQNSYRKTQAEHSLCVQQDHSKILYDPPPRVMEIKIKLNKWDLIKLKIFCTMKETIRKVKRQSPECEKITGNEMTDKELTLK